MANLKMKEAKAGEKVNPLFHVDNFEIDSSTITDNVWPVERCFLLPLLPRVQKKVAMKILLRNGGSVM